MTTFKPLLASILSTPSFPYIASPKLDGLRCVIPESQPLSRTLKLIPNLEIQEVLKNLDLKGLDGELIIGYPGSPTAFKDSTSFVMSKNKVGAHWVYYIFDDFTKPEDTFVSRFSRARGRVSDLDHPNIQIVPHHYVSTIKQLDHFEEECLKRGFEGVMLRDPSGSYKFGRSTVKENILLKLKRFKDDEAVIIGIEEMMNNENPKEENELGRSSRSTNKENMVPAGILGSLTVRSKGGIIFSIGSGFTMKEREELWSKGSEIIGSLVKYKYFEIGEYEKPRFPIFLGLREVGF